MSSSSPPDPLTMEEKLIIWKEKKKREALEKENRSSRSKHKASTSKSVRLTKIGIGSRKSSHRPHSSSSSSGKSSSSKLRSPLTSLPSISNKSCEGLQSIKESSWGRDGTMNQKRRKLGVSSSTANKECAVRRKSVGGKKPLGKALQQQDENVSASSSGSNPRNWMSERRHSQETARSEYSSLMSKTKDSDGDTEYTATAQNNEQMVVVRNTTSLSPLTFYSPGDIHSLTGSGSPEEYDPCCANDSNDDERETSRSLFGMSCDNYTTEERCEEATHSENRDFIGLLSISKPHDTADAEHKRSRRTISQNNHFQEDGISSRTAHLANENLPEIKGGCQSQPLSERMKRKNKQLYREVTQWLSSPDVRRCASTGGPLVKQLAGLALKARLDAPLCGTNDPASMPDFECDNVAQNDEEETCQGVSNIGSRVGANNTNIMVKAGREPTSSIMQCEDGSPLDLAGAEDEKDPPYRKRSKTKERRRRRSTHFSRKHKQTHCIDDDVEAINASEHSEMPLILPVLEEEKEKVICNNEIEFKTCGSDQLFVGLPSTCLRCHPLKQCQSMTEDSNVEHTKKELLLSSVPASICRSIVSSQGSTILNSNLTVQCENKTILEPLPEILDTDYEQVLNDNAPNSELRMDKNQQKEQEDLNEMIHKLLLEKEKLRKRLANLTKAYDDRVTPFRDVFLELRKLRLENARLKKEKKESQAEVSTVLGDLKKEMLVNLTAAVNKTRKLQEELAIVRQEKKELENRMSRS